MSDTPTATTLLDSLDPDAIAARLAELAREEKALRTLLRAARQRRGHQAQQAAVRRKGSKPDVGKR